MNYPVCQEVYYHFYAKNKEYLLGFKLLSFGIIYNLFIFVYKLFRNVLYNVYKEQIKYNHRVPYKAKYRIAGKE